MARRLTRPESRKHNRELLLQSARSLFLRDGYNAASLAGVADAAGFSTGVVYSNFSGKAELALLVLREIQAEQFDALRTALRAAEPASGKLDALRQWSEHALASGWPRLELEFALDARADRELVAVEAERHGAATRLAADALAEFLPPGLETLVPLGTVAEGLISLAIGIAVRRLIDPSVGVDGLIDALQNALASVRPDAD